MMRWWTFAALGLLAVACIGTAAWGAHDAKVAYDCLNNGEYSADITGRGCEAHLGAGHTAVVPLHGPRLPVTGAAALAAIVLVAVVSALLVRRVRVSAS